jgi:hypothetical protein
MVGAPPPSPPSAAADDPAAADEDNDCATSVTGSDVVTAALPAPSPLPPAAVGWVAPPAAGFVSPAPPAPPLPSSSSLP